MTHSQMASYQARVMMSGIERRLKLSSLMILRYVVPFVVYFVRVLFISALNVFAEACSRSQWLSRMYPLTVRATDRL